MTYRIERAIAILALLGSPLIASGQQRALDQTVPEENEIETDRDSFTPATTTLSPKLTQVETATSFIDNRKAPNAYTFPELIVRHGISDRLELRAGWNYAAGGPTSAVSGIDVGTEDFVAEKASELMYGIKLQTTRQRGWLPTSAAIIEGYTPTSGPSNFSRLVASETFGWILPNGWHWSSAVRFNTDNSQGDHFNQWSPSTVLNVPIGQRWNAHVEYFGIMTDGKSVAESQHYFSTGSHFDLTKDFELGVRIGFGLNAQTPPFFVNAGVGFRF
jgi:hypothetical protein